MSYHGDYPKEPIGGSNPYWRCSACKVSDPQINGEVGNHLSWCTWRISMQGGKVTKVFTFDIEGLDREESFEAETEREAWARIWELLTDDEQCAVVSYECVDEQ